mmetsp:Transcript_11153/g.29101  ORF Transcript_11153/g.29101 Transcript_11153/m.29101 type:complete len:426 (+) Transcript_11153:350-1627(+)
MLLQVLRVLPTASSLPSINVCQVTALVCQGTPQGCVIIARLGQHLPQVRHLCCNGVSIDLGLVADVACAVSIAQRVQRLLKVDVSGAHASNHHSTAVTSKGVLQQPGKLGVSVWNVLVVVHDGVDDVAKGQKAAVDVNALLQTCTLSLCALCTLAACQVNKVHLGAQVVIDALVTLQAGIIPIVIVFLSHHAAAAHAPGAVPATIIVAPSASAAPRAGADLAALLQGDGEDGVGAAGPVIHAGRCSGTTEGAHLQHCCHLLLSAHLHLCCTIKANTTSRGLADADSWAGTAGCNQQVSYFLLVNLHKAHPHSALPVLGSLDPRENGVYGFWDDAHSALLSWLVLTAHCVCLATTSLTVCKDGGVVAAEQALHEGGHTFWVQEACLLASLPKHGIIRELVLGATVFSCHLLASSNCQRPPAAMLLL